MTNVDWEDTETADPGDVVCSCCGAEAFRLGVNRAESIKIECANCSRTAAFGWGNKNGTAIHALKPRGTNE